MIKIAVCMKQVPAYSDGMMDEKTGRLIRSGGKNRVNPGDLSALEAALTIGELEEVQISVFSMGPDSARQVLKEAFAMGAQKGYLLSGREFGGADVLSTSYTLYNGIRSQGDFDLILCGRQTLDGDTGQVGGELASWFPIPYFAGVSQIQPVSQKGVQFKQKMGKHTWEAWMDFPCLLSVDEQDYPPRMPSLKLRMAAGKKEVELLELKDLPDAREEHYGTKGSATRVRKIFPPLKTKKQPALTMKGKEGADYLNELVRKIAKIEEETP